MVCMGLTVTDPLCRGLLADEKQVLESYNPTIPAPALITSMSPGTMQGTSC